MHTALLDRSVTALTALRRHVVFSGRLRAQVGNARFACKEDGIQCDDVTSLFQEAPDPTSWRVLDHATAITQAYAIYEAFVFELLREYIAFLASAYTLSELGQDFIAKYTRGIGQILVDQDKAKYENIDMAVLIAEATTALAGADGYSIQPEALLRTEQNLRMEELQRLFAQCGLTNIAAWIKNHKAVRAFFASASRLSQTVDSELKQLVTYRNEAAHGKVDQVLGADSLVEVTEFFEALLNSITDFVQYDTLTRAKEMGRATVLGTITERFKDDIIVAKLSNAKVSVNDTLYILGNNFTLIGLIGSIEMNDVSCSTVEIHEECEVGLRIGVRAREGCEIIRFGSLPAHA